MPAIDVIFDFGSPNAYLAMEVLPSIAARYKARMNVIPCLLGGIFKLTNNQPPLVAFGPVKGKLDYEMKEMRRFIDRHGLANFKFNPHFPVNTLMVMRGQIAADAMGVGEHYRRTVLKALWEDGEKMDDPAVVARVLTAAGLDAEAILARAGSAEVKQALADNTQKAVDRGVFGIPTFFVGGEMFFGKDRLRDLEEELAKG